MEKIGNGYQGYSKSNNAVLAEMGGSFPATQIAKETKTSSKWVKENFEPCEWHHVGKYYTKIDYYDLGEVEEFLERNPNSFKEWKKSNQNTNVLKEGELVYKKVHLAHYYDYVKNKFGWHRERVDLGSCYVAHNGGSTFFVKDKKKSESRRFKKEIYFKEYKNLSALEKLEVKWSNTSCAKLRAELEGRIAKKKKEEEEKWERNFLRERKKIARNDEKKAKAYKKAQKEFKKKYFNFYYKEELLGTFWLAIDKKLGKVVGATKIDCELAYSKEYRDREKAKLEKIGEVFTFYFGKTYDIANPIYVRKKDKQGYYKTLDLNMIEFYLLS